MSIEQWVVIALFILLPLLEGVARLRRTRISDNRPNGRVVQAPPVRRAPLSNRQVSDGVMGTAATSAIPPSPLTTPASNAAVPLASPGGHAGGDTLVQSLRPVRNLRRAIVVATILGPPMSDPNPRAK